MRTGSSGVAITNAASMSTLTVVDDVVDVGVRGDRLGRGVRALYAPLDRANATTDGVPANCAIVLLMSDLEVTASPAVGSTISRSPARLRAKPNSDRSRVSRGVASPSASVASVPAGAAAPPRSPPCLLANIVFWNCTNVPDPDVASASMAAWVRLRCWY